MKKIILGLIGILTIVTALYAGVLTSQSKNGTHTICYYSDGGVIDAGCCGICPATN